MLRSRPVLTATSALLRFHPVAKALGSGESKMPTSGMPMPAASACRRTVSTSQCSWASAGCSMICTPMPCLAIVFERNSEISEPLKPITAEKTNRVPMSMLPLVITTRSRPSSRKVMLMTTSTARLVATKSRMRFMARLLRDESANSGKCRTGRAVRAQGPPQRRHRLPGLARNMPSVRRHFNLETACGSPFPRRPLC